MTPTASLLIGIGIVLVVAAVFVFAYRGRKSGTERRRIITHFGAIHFGGGRHTNFTPGKFIEDQE